MPGTAVPSTEASADRLTRREREILALLAEHLTLPEIAGRLVVAPSSVKTHLKHLYGKLGANSKRQAITRARALGLLDSAPGPEALPTPTPRHNLPLQVTRFFGREQEIDQVRERLAENRLVTLTGPGGVGKTRLLLRAAEAVTDDYADGVWLVELAALADPALVAQRVAQSLSAPMEAGRPPLEALTMYLRDRQALLLLDNCEHLLAACAELAGGLLQACPRLRLLATSREPLGVAGEAIFPVAPLPFPEAGQAVAVAGLDDYAAVGLFVDRARLVLPTYRLQAHNAGPVARLCQRLDGMPLAIEMAAAHMNVLTAEQLSQRLGDAFHQLTGGSRTALPRQQTLRATIDWSYNLLSEPERVLLRRLAAFAGGCTLEAAEAVCADRPLSKPAKRKPAPRLKPAEVLLTLAALVAKSMVIADQRPGDPVRYHLLETVRQYAWEKLEPERVALLRARQADFYLGLVTRHIGHLDTAAEIARRAQLAADLDNMRQALEWAFAATGTGETALRLFLGMAGLWPFYEEERAWGKRAIAYCETHTEVPPLLYAELLKGAAHLISDTDVATAIVWSERAVAMCRGGGPASQDMLIDTLCALGWTYMDIVEDAERAALAYAEAEALFHQLGPAASTPEGVADATAYFALIKSKAALRQGHFAAAKAPAIESLRLYRQVGNPFGVDAMRCLGEAYMGLGEYDQAQVHFMDIVQTVGSLPTAFARGRTAAALYLIGQVDFTQGQLDRARDNGQASLRMAGQLPDHPIAAVCLGLLAAVAAKQGRAPRAACLAGASAALYAQQRRKPEEDWALDRLLPGWQTGAGHAALTAAYEAGRALPFEAAVTYGLDDAVE